MRIIIAEDELLERKAMKKFIQDNFNDFKVVGEAVNGRMAIKQAKELQPDIIFMDIKMPGINGLEAIEKIHATQPLIKFILVTAYDTFEYAKQAMQFGIKDYILKPGKTEEIVKALLRVRKEIINEANMAKEQEQATDLFKESLIRKVMHYPIDTDVSELMRKIMPTMQTGYFLVVGGHEYIAERHIQMMCEKHLNDQWLICETKDTIVVLVMSAEIIKKADQLVTARKLSLDLGEDVYIGIGLVCQSITRMPASFREAYAAYFNLKTAGKSNYSFLKVHENDNNLEQIIQQVSEAVEQGDYNEALARLKGKRHLFGELDKERLYMSIQKVLTKRNITSNVQSLSMLQTPENWEAYLHVCCMEIEAYHQSRKSMTMAREYMNKHYSQAISLEDVASLVNLSPNYFSNLFKEEYDETFIESLTSIRMEKAKYFITENNYSLKEISFMVGYKDPNYFSRVFKRIYNVSPKQFQKGIFEK